LVLAVGVAGTQLLHRRLRGILAPLASTRPGVPEPQRRQQMQRRGIGAAIGHGDPDQHIVRRGLRVLRRHIEVAALVENAGIDQLILGIVAGAAAILGDQLVVRIRALGILVERAHVGVRRRVLEVVVALLHVLAMIALGPREAEESLFENRIMPIPERHREAQAALPVAGAEETGFTPAVGATPGVIVWDIVPDVAVRGVVLANGAPLAFGQVRTPARPVADAPRVLVDAVGLAHAGTAASLFCWTSCITFM